MKALALPPLTPARVTALRAWARLILSATITGMGAAVAALANGVPLDGKVWLGIALLVLKDIQSYSSQTWGNKDTQPMPAEPAQDDPETASPVLQPSQSVQPAARGAWGPREDTPSPPPRLQPLPPDGGNRQVL